MKFDGVLFFPVTPFTAEGDVDVELLKEHISSRLPFGPGGVFAVLESREFGVAFVAADTARPNILVNGIHAENGAVNACVTFLDVGEHFAHDIELFVELAVFVLHFIDFPKQFLFAGRREIGVQHGKQKNGGNHYHGKESECSPNARLEGYYNLFVR